MFIYSMIDDMQYEIITFRFLFGLGCLTCDFFDNQVITCNEFYQQKRTATHTQPSKMTK